ncbi:MAG: type II toxin-antitoxin system death-on-curing family toxin [Candidatus Micrarchaeia archaeon]|jgi:death-on-curing protein
MLNYPSKEQIVLIHNKIIEAFSKEKGEMNLGNLEATLERVKGYTGEDNEALFWKASILLERLILSHPFIDGNKRTAYETTQVFLQANGYVLGAEENETIDLLVGVAESKKNRYSIKAWLEKHAKKG